MSPVLLGFIGFVSGAVVSALGMGIAFRLRKNGIDIPRLPFPCISGDATQLAVELDAIFQFVSAAGDDAVTWYRTRRQPKRFYGWMLRAGVILFTAVAGLIPILSELLPQGEKPVLRAGWSAVALGVAGLCLAFDKFGGYTSGWVRYMIAELEITRLHNAFRFDWQSYKLGCGEDGPNREQAVQGFKLAKAFIQDLDTIVRDETASWSAEFQAAIRELDQSAKTALEIKRTCAVNIKVPNGDKSIGGWTLSLNGGPERPYSGQSASISDLFAGTHTVRAKGKIDDRDVRSEKAFAVSAGAVVDIEVPLV